MTQASLLDRVAAPSRPAVELRPYQVKACDAIEASLGSTVEGKPVRSTLLVMATGTGKTTVFGEVVRRWPGRSMVIAHRDELIRQAARRIHQQTGKRVSVEKADEYADDGCDVVVASIQTLTQEHRHGRFRPDDFGLIVVDEAHHAVADSYRRVLNYFDAKVLGVTATPDRADEEAMGQVFDDVAFIYEIGDAIADGFLCRIRAQQVQCDDMDLSSVKTTAGDLNAGELDAVMTTEAVLHQVARPTLELAGGRRTLVFTTSVENAHRLAEVFCRYRPECARPVDGGMDQVLRRRTLQDHQAGRFQFLVNVGVLTEGYDDPAVACVAMGRPTKSRALYAQMAGRGTRIHPGKEDLLILDFVGNSGRHTLVGAADILGGKYSAEAVEAAKERIAKEGGRDIGEVLAEAAEEIEREKERERARRAKAVAAVRYQTRDVDPFGVFGFENPAAHGMRFGDSPASEKQLALLAKLKVAIPEGLSKRGAGKLISEVFRRRDADLCTFGQMRVLQRYGYEASGLGFQEAKRLMDALAKNYWKRLSAQQEAAVLGRRDAGWDG